MDYFAGLDISMDETHVCVLDREGEVVRESKTVSTAQAIADELVKAPSCSRIVFETGRMAPILFHGLRELGFPVVCVDRGDRRHHGSPSRNQTSHGGGKARDPFACFESFVDEGGGESPREPDSEHDRQTSDLIFQGYSLAHQLLARADQRADGVGRQ